MAGVTPLLILCSWGSKMRLYEFEGKQLLRENGGTGTPFSRSSCLPSNSYSLIFEPHEHRMSNGVTPAILSRSREVGQRNGYSRRETDVIDIEAPFLLKATEHADWAGYSHPDAPECR